MIKLYLALIISQLVFSFARTLNVRYVANEKVLATILSGIVIKITWLVSAAIGITAVIQQDIITIVIYIFSGILGDYLSFKIKVKKNKNG